MDEAQEDDELFQLYNEAVEEFDAGRYSDALPYYEKVLRLGMNKMTLDDRIHVRDTLGKSYFLLERYVDAARHDRDTLATLESSAMYGTTHETTVEIRHRLARALSNLSPQHPSYLKRLEKAVSLHKQNLEAKKSSGNQESKSETLHSLASVLCKLSRYSEAEPIYRQLHKAKSKDSGQATYFESLKLQHEHASVLYHLERYKESKLLLLDIQRAIPAVARSCKPELDPLIRSVDRYLAACIEATNDLNLGVERATRAVNASMMPAEPGPIIETRDTGSRIRSVIPSGLSTPDRLGVQANGGVPSAKASPVRPICHGAGSQIDEKQAVSDGSKETLLAAPVAGKTKPEPGIPTPDVQTSGSQKRHLHAERSIPKFIEALPPSSQTRSAQTSRKHETENDIGRSRMSDETVDLVPNTLPKSSARHHASIVDASSKVEAAVNASTVGTEAKTNDNKGSSVYEETERYQILPPASRGLQPIGSSTPSKAVVPINHSRSSPVLASSSSSTSQTHKIPVSVTGQVSVSENGSTKFTNADPVRARRSVSPSADDKRSDPLSPSTTPHVNTNENKQASVYSGFDNVGRLLSLPSTANDADKWFYNLRQYTHTLLQNGEPKNPGRKPVRVAVLDSGLAITNNDPSSPMARRWRRKVRNKHVQYRDFTGRENAPSYIDNRKDLHGTLCASFVLQMASDADVYIANVVSPDKEGQEPGHVANAIAWAMDNDVDIISMSFGWQYPQKEVDNQIKIARARGILLFAAASNDSDFAPEHGVYPASDSTVYCIYSCRGSGARSEFNPRPLEGKIRFMFPGEDVTLLDHDLKPVEGVGRLCGTSFATPIAAGTAALVLDLVRHELKDSFEVEQRLRTYEGMSDIFKAMSGEHRDGGYYHVRPWTLLGQEEPIESPHNANETHQWYTLMHVLQRLAKRFGKYPAPLV